MTTLKMPYYRKNRLHPIQFREATAEVFYKSMLLESTSLYTVAETPTQNAGADSEPEFRQFWRMG